jgi:hypothetical protein
MGKEVKQRRKCDSLNEQGQPCGTPPLVDEALCLWHSPNHREAAQKARSAGGRRRQKEQMTEVIFDLNDLASLEGQERLYVITVLDTLQLENSPARTRALTALMKTNIDMNQHVEFARRIAELEEAIDQENEIKP